MPWYRAFSDKDRSTRDKAGYHPWCWWHAASHTAARPVQVEEPHLYRPRPVCARSSGLWRVLMFRLLSYQSCSFAGKGIVDYVSNEGTSAVDRALILAEEIAQNGMFIAHDIFRSI